MRLPLAVLVTFVGSCVAANAQSPQGGTFTPSRGYVEVVAQSAFGNVTSQAYGVEAGYNLQPDVRVFVEVTRVRNVAPDALSSNAAAIAAFLADTQGGGAGYTAKEPVTTGLAGIQYEFPTESGKVFPYVMAGAGIAHLTRDVSFTVAGADVTGTLPQLGVVLGSDLSGSSSRAMLQFGAGIFWPAYKALLIDFQLRYGRIFAEDSGINVGRAGIGLGVRF